MSAAQDAMNTLSAQWYNAVTAGCGLSKDEFQLVQGSVPVGTTSENLWAIFDSVPPLTASTFYNPAQINKFSQDYAGVISALIPQGSLQFQKDMGDYYTQWNNYKKTITPPPPTAMAMSQAFAAWANTNLPQSQVPLCTGDYNSMLADPIELASNLLLAVEFATVNPKICAYTTTIGQLNQALNNAPSKSVKLNSTTDSSDVSETWAKTESAGIFGIFGLGGDSSYDDITTKLTTAGAVIDANFEKLVTLTAGPLSQPSTDNELQNYTPWFNGAALHEGYAKPDNTVWKAGDSISWDSTFGPNGNMQRCASALVIVDGITVTMTSNAALSTSEQATFRAAAGGGVFPFWEGTHSEGWNRNVSFDDQGNVTVTSTSPIGNPQILGVLVSRTADTM